MSDKQPNQYLDESQHVGLVESLSYIHKDLFELENGQLDGFTLAYEAYGTLNEDGSNALLVCHALTGDHRAAGIRKDPRTGDLEQKPGWWNHVIGPGKAIDTNKFYVVCSNCLGACQGSTGPASLKPDQEEERYGMDFPEFTIHDMVHAQKKLLEHLGVQKLFAVVGGSMGGMQTLQWIVDYPSFVERGLVIAATPRHSAQTIAFNEVGRQAIRGDEAWNQGGYDTENGPTHGLGVARMMAHITYLSDLGMEKKFRQKPDCKQNEDLTKVVNSYLGYQAQKFIDRFDANTYLKLTRALDRFDLVGKRGLDDSLKGVLSKVLVIAFSSDWLYTPAQNQLVTESLHRLGKEASYLEIDHTHGHDSFLIGSEDFLRAVRVFFSGMDKKEEREQNLGRFRQVSSRYDVKKEADFKVIDEWVSKGQRVLDLGCGRGILLEYLRDSKQVQGLGVDFDRSKAISCIARGVSVYQQDIRHALANLPDDSFDWVIFSRMVEELPEPGAVILEALRVGKRVAVSFVNHAYWRNRLNFLRRGKRVQNEVYPHRWEQSGLRNHFSIEEFEQFCAESQGHGHPFEIGRKIFHQGDGVKHCTFMPNLRSGLAIYELIKA